MCCGVGAESGVGECLLLGKRGWQEVQGPFLSLNTPIPTPPTHPHGTPSLRNPRHELGLPLIHSTAVLRHINTMFGARGCFKTECLLSYPSFVPKKHSSFLIVFCVF